ncbi:Uncharacterised protein [Mycobacterium tuberculosis]|nr:Uncharacterised protein [Mycobacterium tuberculosis]
MGFLSFRQFGVLRTQIPLKLREQQVAIFQIVGEGQFCFLFLSFCNRLSLAFQSLSDFLFHRLTGFGEGMLLRSQA